MSKDTSVVAGGKGQLIVEMLHDDIESDDIESTPEPDDLPVSGNPLEIYPK